MCRKLNVKNKVFHRWTEQEKKYLKKITPGHHYKEIQKLMANKFNYDFSLEQIKGAIGRYRLNTGFTGQFLKGNVPANKGKKGICPKGCEKTWFKKGNKPINHRPVGSERIDADGYTLIKVKEPNQWRLKHQVVWEKYKGPIPKGYNVIFGDSNKRNFDINNLILLSKKQLLIMNRNRLIQKDAELTRTAVIVADIYSKMSERRIRNKV